MDELKAIARDLGVEPTGDRRKRKTWEQAIEQHQLFLVSQSSDTSAAFPGVESEPVVLSDRFVAAYAPPQAQIHYQIDADGQLSLLYFEIEAADEPPDPDDFESLDAFHEAIALWDLQHPIDVSFDSFTYWAPCPDDWYEPAGENSPGVDRVQALERKNSPGVDRVQALLKSSIPTFDAWCDRPNDTDEPPETGIFARLPKPKPPGFPPMAIIAGDRTNHIKKFARSATLLSGRSPPGGDAMI